jgi:hypothetical protein
VRDPARYRASRQQQPLPHPCFRVVDGPTQPWEKVG